MKLFILLLSIFIGLTIALSPKCPSPDCGGALATVYYKGDNCSFLHVNPGDGKIQYISSLSVCQDIDPTLDQAVAHTAYNYDHQLFYIVTGQGKFLHGIHIYTGEEFIVCQLPDSYDYIVGLSIINDNLYLVTSSKIWVLGTSSEGSSFSPVFLFTQSLSHDAVASSNSPLLYIVDHTNFISLNTTTFESNSIALPSPFSFVIDLQYYTINGTLLMLDTYKLYSYNPVTGQGSFLMKIPDGSGYPRMNTIFYDMFYFADFNYLYGIELESMKLRRISFPSIYCYGFFQYYF